MKKIIAFLMMSVFLLAAAPAYAAENDAAVYLNKDFYSGSSMQVNGNIVSVDGKVTFNSSIDNIVNGNIIVKDESNYIEESPYSLPTINGDVKQESGLVYSFEPVAIAPSPEIANVVEEFTFGWWPIADAVTADTYYKKLTVTNELVVDTTNGDITIAADDLRVDGRITILGGGKLTLYVNNSLNVGGGSLINENGSPDKLTVIISGNMDLNNNVQMWANVYCGGDSLQISNSANLYGSIYSNASNAAFNGNVSIHGTVYLPNADVEHISSSKIYGMLIANSLKMGGSSVVSFDEQYAYINPFISSDNNTTDESDDSGIIGIEQVDNVLIPNNVPNTEYKLGKLTNEYAYIYGYNDVQMAPDEKIIRAEASALLYRLMNQNNMLDGYTKPTAPSYNDLSLNDWFYNGIEYMTFINVYNSEGIDNVYPHEKITRGEAAKIFVFAMGLDITDKDVDFIDLSKDNVFYKYIATLANYGYMIGDGDGIMRPDDYISRAEFVKIYNIIIGRDSSYNYTITTSGDKVECPFVDLSPSEWYYDDIMRATHSFEGKVVAPDKRLSRDVVDN